MKRSQSDPPEEDEDAEDEEFDQDTQEILQALREEAEANDEENDEENDRSSRSSPETPTRSFGDVFWEKNFIAAITVTKYLGASCVVVIFLFFVTLILKAFAFR